MTAVASADRWLAAGAVAALAAVAVALVTQHVFDMQPCPWCVLQRLVYLLIASCFVLALASRRALPRRLGAGLGLGLALSGMAAALWQHFVAAATASCNLTLADRIVSGLTLDALLPEIFQARASCADAATRLLGVPYEFWSLALFTVLALAALKALAAPLPGRRARR